jgi:hypothetical protein
MYLVPADPWSPPIGFWLAAYREPKPPPRAAQPWIYLTGIAATCPKRCEVAQGDSGQTTLRPAQISLGISLISALAIPFGLEPEFMVPSSRSSVLLPDFPGLRIISS